MKHLSVFLTSLMMGIGALYAQISLSGKVLDEQGAPVAGASVYLHETHQGDISDAEGKFRIDNIRPGTYHLHAVFIGFHAWSGHVSLNKVSSFAIVLHETVNQLHEILVEGNLLQHDHRENPLSSSNVSASYVKEQAGIGLMPALQRMPGISSINMGAGISKPVVRGLSGNRVLVAENGIKQEGQQWGNDHGLEIDAYNAEQIEVIRGPSVLMFGSDAIGGVLHIRPASSGKAGIHHAEIRSFYQSVNDNLGLTASLKGNTGKFMYRLRYTRQQYADLKVPATEFIYNSFRLPIHEGRLMNTAGQSEALSATIGWNRKWGYSHLTASAYHQDEGIFAGATGAARAYELSSDGDFRNLNLPRQRIRHYKLISNNNIMLGRFWLEADAGMQYNQRREFSRPHAHGRPISFADTTALSLDLFSAQLNARLYLSKTKNLSRVLGYQGGMQLNEQDGFEFLIPSFLQHQHALFYIVKRNTQKWTLQYGGRLDFTSLIAESSPYDFYYRFQYMGSVLRNETFHKNVLNYALSSGAVYHFDEHREFRANLAKSFRMPQPSEYASNGVHHGTFRFEQGNINLKPEQGLMSDIGYNEEFHRYHYSVSTYLNYFFNYIYLQPSARFATIDFEGVTYPYPEPGQVFRYEQAPVWHYGAEAEAGMKIGMHWRSQISAEYTWLYRTDNGMPLPFIPPASLKSDIYWNHPLGKSPWSIDINTGFGWYFSRVRMATNEPETPAYALWNARMAVTKKAKNHTLETGINAQNLLNSLYYNNMSRYRFLNLPEAGRNIQLYLEWKPRFSRKT